MKVPLKKPYALIFSFLLLAFIATHYTYPTAAVSVSGSANFADLKFPGPDDQFIVYYKRWPDDDNFYKKMGERYKLIILNTGDLVPPKDIENDAVKVVAYKKRRIKMLRDAGAMVFGYQSIGSENIEGNGNQPYEGDKLGPCSCADAATCCKKGFASYYIDDGNGKPLIHKTDEYVSAPVNAGSAVWRRMMHQAARENLALGCTGLFLDTMDTATDVTWARPGTMTLLEELYKITPNLIVNRGIRLLDTESAATYKKFSWAIMFENFFTEWEGNKGVKSKYWKGNLEFVPRLKDKNVLIVDFATCAQLEKTGGVVSQQREAVSKVNTENGTKWPNYLADYPFAEIRYKFKCEK